MFSGHLSEIPSVVTLVEMDALPVPPVSPVPSVTSAPGVLPVCQKSDALKDENAMLRRVLLACHNIPVFGAANAHNDMITMFSQMLGLLTQNIPKRTSAQLGYFYNVVCNEYVESEHAQTQFRKLIDTSVEQVNVTIRDKSYVCTMTVEDTITCIRADDLLVVYKPSPLSDIEAVNSTISQIHLPRMAILSLMCHQFTEPFMQLENFEPLSCLCTRILGIPMTDCKCAIHPSEIFKFMKTLLQTERCRLWFDVSASKLPGLNDYIGICLSTCDITLPIGYVKPSFVCADIT